MHSIALYSLLCLALTSCSNALPGPVARIQRKGPCSGNTPSTRNQWCGYDIHSDYYSVIPDTGITREYWLEISEIVFTPDGIPRFAQAINGTVPGPTIFADWGDNVVVHLTSNLKTSTNGSSFHFHGTHQNYTNPQDGVVAITQCPTAPGSSTTYKWRATQYGTSWYHSHFGLQTYDGVYGGLIIRGPASANYDEDVGTIMLSDWSHRTVNEILPEVQRKGPYPMDNVLINGTNTYNKEGEKIRLAKGLDWTLKRAKHIDCVLSTLASILSINSPLITILSRLLLWILFLSSHMRLTMSTSQLANAWIFSLPPTKLQRHRLFGSAPFLSSTAPRTPTHKTPWGCIILFQQFDTYDKRTKIC
ncbi:hypothetical protein NXS19_013553 [Fusarium pseudograminearum]|nr:hypothetical protein NXS19_013553 [Fusarium pseudograminearum]